MKDRELLERAAKALGMPLTDNGVRNLGQWEWLHCGDKEWGLYANNANGTQRRWNPLLSDGDALRLAVKVNLLVMPYPFDRAVRVVDSVTAENTVVSWGTPPDPCAATRRAIVLAAAKETPNVRAKPPEGSA